MTSLPLIVMSLRQLASPSARINSDDDGSLLGLAIRYLSFAHSLADLTGERTEWNEERHFLLVRPDRFYDRNLTSTGLRLRDRRREHVHL